MEKLLTVEQVAQYLSVKKSTIYKWIYAGLIPATRLGSLWRFNQADVNRWIEANKNETQSRIAASQS